MNRPAERRASYDQILALPEHLVGEILNGVLHTHPRPTPRHANACSVLGYTIGGPFHGGVGGPGGWWIIIEPELYLGSDVIVPDVAGWRRERMPQLPESAWFEMAPDWVSEILSPSTARIDRALKMRLYARAQVPHLWLIDPDPQTLEIYRLEGEHWLLPETLKEDDLVRQPPFYAVAFPLDSLWA